MFPSTFQETPVSSTVKSRRAHINQGPQITPRLEALFEIVGEQGAIRFDQAQRWLARLSPEQHRMKDVSSLSEERTRKVLRPWIDEEVFQYRVFFARQKGWLWLSPKGMKYTKLSLRYYEPSPASLAHLAAVNDVRLLLAQRRPEARWRSERVLRAERSSTAVDARRHLPDAELLTEKGAIAIETELTVKSEKRLHEILLDLASNARYYTIWYFAPAPVYQVLRHALKALPPKAQPLFRCYDLEGKEYYS